MAKEKHGRAASEHRGHGGSRYTKRVLAQPAMRPYRTFGTPGYYIYISSSTTRERGSMA